MESEKQDEAVNGVEELKLQKEIWEKAVDTQMHFNEMSVKSRQLGLTFVVAAIGVAVVLLGKDKDVLLVLPINHWGWSTVSTHVAGVVVVLAAFGLWAVMKLDLGVYHHMLRGAVAFGEELESKILVPRLMHTTKGMTESISFFSRKHPTRNAEGGWTESKERLARNKIAWFYYIAIGMTVVLGVILIYLYGNVTRIK